MTKEPFTAFLGDRAFDDVQELLSSEVREQSIVVDSSSKVIGDLISLDSTPFDVFVETTRIYQRRNDVFEPFRDDFILEHVDDYISMLGPSLVVQKMFKRDSSRLEAAAFNVLENQAPHLLYEWWTIRRCIELSHGPMERDGLSSTLFQIGIQRKVGIYLGHLAEDPNLRQRVIDSLSCYKDLYHTSSFSQDSKLCFLEFFGVVRKQFEQILMFKDIVMGLKLMHCALEYGEDTIYQDLLKLQESSLPENVGKTSIFHDAALLKRPVAVSNALGVGASADDTHLYPDDHKILFQTDEMNLSPLNYLWIIQQPTQQSFKKINRNWARRLGREEALQNNKVEGALKCLQSFELKFPGIKRHFVYAWTGAVKTLRNSSCEGLSLFTIDMVKHIIQEIASFEDRKPFHVACEYGILWSTGLRSFYRERGNDMDDLDPKTSLKPFALAASGNEGDLNTVYELLRLSPTAIL